MEAQMIRFLGKRDGKLGSDIVVEMKRIQEMNEDITKRMDNEGSESRSWIGSWKCATAIIHYTLCNTHYSFFTMACNTRMSLVGWA